MTRKSASVTNPDLAVHCYKEAESFAVYIANRKPNQSIIELYEHIVKGRGASASSNDDIKLLGFALRHPWSIGILDSYLALFNPNCELRHRIYIMIGVLETDPEYNDYFLPKKHSPIYLLYVIFVLIRACIKIPFGFALSIIARTT